MSKQSFLSRVSSYNPSGATNTISTPTYVKGSFLDRVSSYQPPTNTEVEPVKTQPVSKPETVHSDLVKSIEHGFEQATVADIAPDVVKGYHEAMKSFNQPQQSETPNAQEPKQPIREATKPVVGDNTATPVDTAYKATADKLQNAINSVLSAKQSAPVQTKLKTAFQENTDAINTKIAGQRKIYNEGQLASDIGTNNFDFADFVKNHVPLVTQSAEALKQISNGYARLKNPKTALISGEGLRGATDVLLGNVHLVFGLIPPLAVTYEISTFTVPIAEKLGEQVGGETGKKIAGKVAGILTMLPIGMVGGSTKALLSGLVSGSVTESAAEAIISDMDINDEDKKRIQGVAQQLGFLAGTVAHVKGSQWLNKAGEVDIPEFMPKAINAGDSKGVGKAINDKNIADYTAKLTSPETATTVPIPEGLQEGAIPPLGTMLFEQRMSARQQAIENKAAAESKSKIEQDIAQRRLDKENNKTDTYIKSNLGLTENKLKKAIKNGTFFDDSEITRFVGKTDNAELNQRLGSMYQRGLEHNKTVPAENKPTTKGVTINGESTSTKTNNEAPKGDASQEGLLNSDTNIPPEAVSNAPADIQSPIKNIPKVTKGQDLFIKQKFGSVFADLSELEQIKIIDATKGAKNLREFKDALNTPKDEPASVKPESVPRETVPQRKFDDPKSQRLYDQHRKDDYSRYDEKAILASIENNKHMTFRMNEVGQNSSGLQGNLDALEAELAKRKASEPKNENPATPGNPAIQPKSEASAKPESVPRETVPQEETLYHGTKKDFKEFDNSKMGTSTDEGWLGAGHYFHSDPNRGGYGDIVKSANVNLQNPINLPIHNAGRYLYDLIGEKAGLDKSFRDKSDMQIIKEIGSKRFSELAQEMGYDGVIANYMQGTKEVVAFDAKSIKNVKTVEPKNETPATPETPAIQPKTETSLTAENDAKYLEAIVKVMMGTATPEEQVFVKEYSQKSNTDFGRSQKPTEDELKTEEGRQSVAEVYDFRQKSKNVSQNETGNEILKKDLNSAIQPENATSAEMKPGTNPPVESPGSQEIGTSKVETPITETPATGKVSKAARDINNSLVEQGFDELPASELAKYTPITKKETTERVTNLISDDPDLARKAATGQEAMPSDIHPQVLFNAVKNKAIQDGDVNLQRDLAKSPIATERSVAAQTLGASGFDNNPLKADLVTAMQEVGKARIEATAKKLGGEKNLKTTKEIVVKQIKAEITKKIPTKMDWSQFIESIQC